MEGLLFALTLAAALGCGVNGGVFFAFSSFVMPALGKLDPVKGNEAMQSINVQAPTPAFMTALLGTGALCAVLAVWGATSLDEGYGPYLLAGALVYLAGTIVMTGAFHIPRNNELAASNPASTDGKEVWARYLTEWTRGNHLRALSGVVAAGLFAVALTGG